MSSPDTVIAALRTEHDALVDLVSPLTDEDLARPSGASEWDVSEVLSHIGSGAEIMTGTLRAALAGEPSPGREAMEAIWDVWNAKTRRQRADDFPVTGEELTALYESLDADTRENLRIEIGFLPAPIDVETLGRMRLSELSMHAWDVRVAFDETAALTPETATQLLHGAPDLIAWIGKSDPLEGTDSVIRVTTTGPDSVFALRLQAPISVDFDVPETPAGTLELPAEAWLRLAAGRLTAKHTPSGVATTGTVDLELLRQVFPGY